MQLTTTYIDSWSTLPSTTKININYKDTLFDRSNLTPIRGGPTFETIHKLQNYIKANAKSVYSNLVGGSHGHLGLVITYSQYTLISPTPFVYPTHLGSLIILYGTTTHANSNRRIVHTKEVRLFHEVTGVEQALVKKYLARSRKHIWRISAT